MKYYEKALSLCLRAHEGQYRMDGVTPYSIHPIMVERHISMMSYSEDVQITALLHDVIEDCTYIYTQEIMNTFNRDICDALHVLTKKKGQSYDEYIKNVKENEIARLVKISDIKHNLHSLPEEGFENRKDKYRNALERLKNE